MTGKPVVLLDLDGPVYDWGTAFNSVILGIDDTFPVTDPETWTAFNVYSEVPGESHQEARLRAFAHPDLYRTSKLMPGVAEAVAEMREVAELFFCSAPDPINKTCESDKKASLARDFGDWSLSRLLLFRDKTLARGELLIDDRPDIHGVLDPVWRHAVFDAPYNQQIDTGLRVLSDWSNWREVFERAEII